MDLEEDERVEEKISFHLNKNLLLKTLIIGSVGLFFTGLLSYHFSQSYITIGLSFIIGLTLCILLSYFILISQPVFYEIKQSVISEEEQEQEFHSTMKM